MHPQHDSYQMLPWNFQAYVLVSLFVTEIDLILIAGWSSLTQNSITSIMLTLEFANL